MRLLRNEDNGAIVDFTAERLRQPNYTELSEEEIRGYFANQSPAAGHPVGRLKLEDGIIFHTSSAGIGDAIVGLYAACGVAAAGYKVTHYARHTNWLGRCEHENLTLHALPTTNQSVCGVDVNQDYQDQLWEAYVGRLESRAHWYIRSLRKAYPDLPEGIAPARPQFIERPEDPALGEYILISPYATRPSRNWPASNYARLASALIRHGRQVIALVPVEYKPEAHIMESSGAKVLIDYPPKYIRQLVAHARLVVGGDSGMAHLAGLFNTPALAIMAQAGVRYTFWCGDSVTGILPDHRQKCRLCHWQKEGGTEPACGYFCAALGTISPYDVLDEVLIELGKKGTIPVFVRS